MPNKEHITSNILASLRENSVNILITNLADASVQLQEAQAEIAALKAEVAKLSEAKDKASAPNEMVRASD